MILSIVNQKGGVGKTTTAINLAHWFALERKMAVLLIDFDVQGHAGRSLGIGKGSGLYRWLVDETPVRDVAEVVRPGQSLEVVTSDKSTEKIKLHLVAMIGREYFIAQRMAEAAEFDLVILDLGPGSDLLHVGALIASDGFIVPAKLDFLALDGVMEVIKTVNSLGAVRGVEPPQLLGVLPTLYDRKTMETLSNLRRLREALGTSDLVLPPIPMDTRIREASSQGLTIWEYAPRSPAAIGYEAGSDVTNREGRVGGYLHLAEIVERAMR